MIYLIICYISITWFLIWMHRHIGFQTSISSSFYENKTRWTYTMVFSGTGALLGFIDPYSLLHYAGLALVLGTAAPHFRHGKSLSKLIHYSCTLTATVLAWWYVGGWIMGVAAGVLIAAAKGIEPAISKRNPVLWAEIVILYTTLIGTLTMLIS